MAGELDVGARRAPWQGAVQMSHAPHTIDRSLGYIGHELLLTLKPACVVPLPLLNALERGCAQGSPAQGPGRRNRLGHELQAGRVLWTTRTLRQRVLRRLLCRCT